MIPVCVVAQCAKCHERWSTPAIVDHNVLGQAVAVLAASLNQGLPVCIHCSGGTASDKEVHAHTRAVERAKGTDLPYCPQCLERSEEDCMCESGGAALGWWGKDGRWHRSSLEERPRTELDT